jgi:glycosyltransferase involved in cell wall biosynthesis
MRLALVLWNGNLGGAETFSAALARQLRADGVDAGLVFVGSPEPLARELDDVPHMTVGLSRGRQVLLRPFALARATRDLGPDGALVVSPGYLPATLRLGRYRGPIVVVNHGAFMHDDEASAAQRAKQRAVELSGAWAPEVEVAVSNLVLELLRERPHAKRLVRIYNGVDLDAFRPADNHTDSAPTFGWAGRLVPGKGVDDLLRALAQLRENGAKLRIAGDGPARVELQRLAASLGLDERVTFEGSLTAMASFWRGCDVAAMPSNQWVESFGMAAVEAMACGLPVVATRSGALPEVVEDGRTGALCARGDVPALAAALSRYAMDPELRRTHGRAARERCASHFDLKDCAAAYRSVFESVGGPG